MKIAFITDHYAPKMDGVVTRLTSTIDYLLAAGNQVLLITSVKQSKSSQTNFSVLCLPAIHFPLTKRRHIAWRFNRAKKALDSFQADIIHIVNLTSIAYFASSYAQKNHIPLVCSIHTDYLAYLSYFRLPIFRRIVVHWFRKLNRVADLILCTSTFMQGKLKTLGVTNALVWQPGSASLKQPYSSQELRKIRNKICSYDIDKPVLIYVGRVSREKNIASLKSLLSALPELQLAIIGDGRDRSRLKRIFANTHTTFIRKVNKPELNKIYSAADALILPSKTETVGLVLLEAMACHCPVIAANAGGIVDIIQDRQTGLLYQADNQTVLLDAVEYCLQDKTATQTRVNKAYHFAAQMSWEAANQQLWQYYQSLLEK